MVVLCCGFFAAMNGGFYFCMQGGHGTLCDASGMARHLFTLLLSTQSISLSATAARAHARQRIAV